MNLVCDLATITFLKSELSMQEMSFNEIEEVSGGIVPFLLAGAAIAGGAVAVVELGKAVGAAYYYLTN